MKKDFKMDNAMIRDLNSRSLNTLVAELQKEKQIRVIYKKFNRRLKVTELEVQNALLTNVDVNYVMLWRKGKPYFGACSRAKNDRYDARIVRILCYSRALGWTDIEQELLDALN